MGAQLTIVGGWNDPPNRRYNGYKGFYPQISGNPSISGDTITLEAGFIRTRHRVTGLVSISVRFRSMRVGGTTSPAIWSLLATLTIG